jgi:hypothetical protein
VWLPYRAQPAATLPYALHVFQDRAILQLASARCPGLWRKTAGNEKAGTVVPAAPVTFRELRPCYSFWLRKSRYRTVNSAVRAAAM